MDLLGSRRTNSGENDLRERLSKMEEGNDVLIYGDLVLTCASIDCWSDDDSDYDDDDYDDDDDVEYDKNGHRFRSKTIKYKGDDRSKAIDWKKYYPRYQYDQLNEKQSLLALKEHHRSASRLAPDHSIDDAVSVFGQIFGRGPGVYRQCEYVRNVPDCDYYCKVLLESPILPGIVGVDIEMENDSRPFKEWHSRWRTIRAHSRLAKGMFARTLQVSNCCGLVVVFDLYALSRPHCWSGGIECDMKDARTHQRIPLPTSALPQSLVRLILDPNIVRFGWALHCDWSSLYNSFGLLVPQLSYLDAQSPWRYELSAKLNHRGNGLADAASALFGIHLDKALRGYGHYWHGKGPKGIIPPKLVMYAAIDAQTSLDVALYIMTRTEWLEDWRNVWMSSNVQSKPMPGVRKRVCGLYGEHRWNVDPNNASPHRSVDSGLGRQSSFTDSSYEERVPRGYEEKTSRDPEDPLQGHPCIGYALANDDPGELRVDPEERIQGDEEELQVSAVQEEERMESEVQASRNERMVYQVENEIMDSEEVERKLEIRPSGKRKTEVTAAKKGMMTKESRINDNIQIAVIGTRRSVQLVGTDKTTHAKRKNARRPPADDNNDWLRIPLAARRCILKSKREALAVFRQLVQSRNSTTGGTQTDDWTMCPAFMVLRGVKHHALKKIILKNTPASVNKSKACVKRTSMLYRKARSLCDANLESAWRRAITESAQRMTPPRGASLLKQCEKFENDCLRRMMTPNANLEGTSKPIESSRQQITAAPRCGKDQQVRMEPRIGRNQHVRPEHRNDMNQQVRMEHRTDGNQRISTAPRVDRSQQNRLAPRINENSKVQLRNIILKNLR